MAQELTQEQQKTGRDNFHRVVGGAGVSRRDFMKGLIAAGATLPVAAATYFGYQRFRGKPVRAGLIGAGDQGGVLVGLHNPEFIEFIAYSDIRPSSQERIFKGERTGPRQGFNRIYGNDSARRIKLYERYTDLLQDKDIEAVVIALPLHLHAQAAIAAFQAGKHVFTEKLLAWNISQCKDMLKAQKQHDRVLAVGHQRHYSLLYAHALEVMRSDYLGEVHHIRAQWHRNNALPVLDAEGKPVLNPKTGRPRRRDSWSAPVPAIDRDRLGAHIHDLGYKSLEELVRWRLYRRTSGGLMAELGSHQLDACGLFLGGVHPLAVSGAGGKLFYHDDREVDDHVFCTFEYPGKTYFADPARTVVKNPDDRVIVTYSSINTNAFDPYGECVMGTRGTMLVQAEQEVLLYPETGASKGRSLSVSVTAPGPDMTVIDASATTAPAEQKALQTGQAALGASISKGYREELEDFAFWVRMWDAGYSRDGTRGPRCGGEVGLADAIVALTANQAIRRQSRIEFRRDWFDPASPEVPDPDMKA
jgi:predicted dehydrogenase